MMKHRLGRKSGPNVTWKRQRVKTHSFARPPLTMSPVSLRSQKKKVMALWGLRRVPLCKKNKPLLNVFSLFADNVYRKCLANGTWALKGNYSMCKAILHEEVSGRRDQTTFSAKGPWASSRKHNGCISIACTQLGLHLSHVRAHR